MAFCSIKNKPKYRGKITNLFSLPPIEGAQTVNDELNKLCFECDAACLDHDGQLRSIRERVENLNINYVSGIVWGIILSFIGLITLCWYKVFSFAGLIPLGIGIIKVIAGVRHKKKLRANIDEIDKSIERTNEYFDFVCKPKARKLCSFIDSHIVDFNGATNYPKRQEKPDEHIWKPEEKDILATSIGIETTGGVFTKLIEKNTPLPAKKSQVFSTASDGQTSVEVHVLEGENEMAKYNKTVGRFNVMGIIPAPKGVPKIEVIFSVDMNGKLNVSAKDLASGHEKAVSINRNK